MYTQLLDLALGVFVVVIFGIVPQEDRVLTPAWYLIVQFFDQVLEEHHEDVAVGGGLGQSVPCLPI